MCGVSKNKEKLKKIVKKLPEELSSDPNNICQILLILSYIDKKIMAEFWDDCINHRSFANRLLCRDMYNICQNIVLLFWVDNKYGKHIWDRIDKEKLKAHLNEIKKDISIPKAIGTFRLYLPNDIITDFMGMFDLDDIISKISALNEGFHRDYYIAMFSLFGLDYKEKLEEIFDIDSFIKHIPHANLVELSICIKYLFNAYPKYKPKLFDLNYKALTTRFNQEDYLDGVLRAIESIYIAYPEVGKELCRKLNLDGIGAKLKRDKLQYKTKEQFIEFVRHVDSSVGEKLLEKAAM